MSQKIDKRKLCTPEKLARLKVMREKAAETNRNKKLKAQQEEEEREKNKVIAESQQEDVVEDIVSEVQPEKKKKVRNGGKVVDVPSESESESEYEEPPVPKRKRKSAAQKQLSLIDKDELVSIIKETLAPQESKEEKRLRKLEETYQYIKSRDSGQGHVTEKKSFVEPPKRNTGNLSLW